MIGESLRKLRDKYQISIVELAKAIDEPELYLAQIERDIFKPSYALIFKLSRHFNVEPVHFMEDMKTKKQVKVEKNVPNSEELDASSIQELLFFLRLKEILKKNSISILDFTIEEIADAIIDSKKIKK